MCIEGLCGCFPWESLTVLSCYTTTCNNVCVRECACFTYCFWEGLNGCVFLYLQNALKGTERAVWSNFSCSSKSSSVTLNKLSLSRTHTHTHPEPSKTHLFQWLQGHQKVSELKNLPEVNCSPFEADTAGNHTHTLVKKAFNQKETQVLRCAPSSPRLAVRNVMTCEDKRPRRCFTLTHRDTE